MAKMQLANKKGAESWMSSGYSAGNGHTGSYASVTYLSSGGSNRIWQN